MQTKAVLHYRKAGLMFFFSGQVQRLFCTELTKLHYLHSLCLYQSPAICLSRDKASSHRASVLFIKWHLLSQCSVLMW